MKIIIHIENLYKGGVDTSIIKLINAWPNKNDTFLIISNVNHPNNEYIKNNIGQKNQLITYYVPLFTLAIHKLPRYFNTFFFKLLIYFFLIPIKFILMFIFISSLKGDVLLVANGGYPGGETSRMTSIIWRILRRKNNFHNINNLAVNPKRYLEKIYEKVADFLMIKSVDNFICVSNISETFLRKRKSFANLNNISFIYYGIDKIIKNSINLKSHLKISKNSKICLVLATYEPRKGHEFLIKSFKLANKSIDDLHLVFIGHLNSLHQEYYNKIKKLESKNIHFLKHIDNASGLIDQSNVLLLGSQEYESFGLVALEAMIKKIPIIATNIGAFCEVIGENDLGIIVDKNNEKECSNQIIRYFKDPKIRRSVINYCTNRSKLFTEKKMGLNYYNVLCSNMKNE